jgi:hypothetical protein
VPENCSLRSLVYYKAAAGYKRDPLDSHYRRRDAPTQAQMPLARIPLLLVGAEKYR